MTTENTNRRNFLKLSLIGATTAVTDGCTNLSRTKPVPPPLPAAAPTSATGELAPSSLPASAPTSSAGVLAPRRPPSPRLALLGTGGSATALLRYFSESGAQIAAICDVDERELHAARDLLAPRFPSLQLFQDYRVMLNTPGQLDGVVIATPDHGHALQALCALRAGCHLYLETPVTHTLAELAALTAEARRARRHVFCGELHTGCDPALRAQAALATGVIGKISQVHAWSSGPIWPQGGEPPIGSDPVPSGLAWDLWLAGAQPRPYKRFVYHKFNWRGWCDFGGGALGDAGCQLLSFPYTVLGLSAPESVTRLTAQGGTAASYPKSSTLRWTCKSAAQRNQVELFWYDGGEMPAADLLAPATATLGRSPATGVLLVGEHGTWRLLAAPARGTTWG